MMNKLRQQQMTGQQPPMAAATPRPPVHIVEVSNTIFIPYINLALEYYSHLLK